MTDLAIPDEPITPANLFGVGDPQEVVRRSTETANALTEVIRTRSLYANIQGRSHVLVDGWTLLGSMLGVFPIVVWTRKLAEPEGWEARVEARTLAGDLVGAAEAQCTREENAWSYEPTGKGGKKLPPRDDYALRSMAQTRATSKALRGPLGFIVHLAGFAATPAEEMPVEGSVVDNAGMSSDQRGLLHHLIGELDRALSPDDYPDWEGYVHAWIAREYGKTSRTQLTRAETSKLIDHLQTIVDALPV